MFYIVYIYTMLIYSYRHIIVVFLYVTGCVCFSQNYINYTEREGLASNFVYRMTQDKRGFIWFLTDKGMSKFDGSTFKNFTVKDGLPNNDIWHIRLTPDGRVWYFTRSDRLGYIENDSVYSFTSSDHKMMNPSAGINQSGNTITILGGKHNYQFTDSIWQAMDEYSQEYMFRNKDIVFLGDNLTNNRLETGDGNLLYSFKKRKSYFKNEQLNDSLFVRWDDEFYEIINLNHFRVINESIDTLKLNPEMRTTVQFHFQNEQLQLSENQWVIDFDSKLNHKSIHYIPKHLKSTFNFKDRDGFIWTATSKNGVYKLPIHFDAIDTYFKGQLIIGIEVIGSTIYVAVSEDGVYKIENNTAVFLFHYNGYYYSTTQLKDTIFHNLTDYSMLEKEGGFQKFSPKWGNFGKQLVSFKDNYYIVGFSGLGRFSQNFNLQKGYLEHPNYEGLFIQNDSLFSFSFKNLLYYSEGKDAFSEYKKEQIQKILLASISINNETYLGTEGDGLYKFSEGKLTKLIPGDRYIINSISWENENSIWAVSEGILLNYYRTKSNQFSVKKYNQLNGYPTNNLTDILCDNNKLYLGSTSGLSVIKTKDIARINSFTPYIKNIYVNGKKTIEDSLHYDYDTNLKLKVNFGSINFFDPNTARFSYRLSPIQSAWTTTESGEVNLYDLKPDNYRLELKVTHTNTNQLLYLPITIIPRWWQTELVLILSLIAGIFLFLLIITLIFRYFRNKLLQERHLAQLELRALRSQMNPHFVHNSLNAIQYYIQRHEVELSENYLAKFSKLIRLFFEYSRKRNLTIKEEVSLLDQYLQIEKMRFEDKLEYTIEVDDSLDTDEQLIPSMILQPIVENAVNHGLFHKNEKGNVLIHFKYIDASTFIVLIQDDGIGINKAKKIYEASSKNYQSRSSAVLQERLELLSQSKDWNISYSIKDRSEMEETTGTNVILTFNQFREE